MKITPTDKEKTFEANVLLVTKTDLKGKITYANRAFMEIVEMNEDLLIGQPHNVIRHPDMPSVIFKYLWKYLQAGDEIHAYVKNLCSDGSYYWVLANVTPSFDNSRSSDGTKIIGYHSARRLPSQEALNFIKPFYKKLRQAETSGGIAASEKIMSELLQDKGVSYDEFILSI